MKREKSICEFTNSQGTYQLSKTDHTYIIRNDKETICLSELADVFLHLGKGVLFEDQHLKNIYEVYGSYYNKATPKEKNDLRRKKNEVAKEVRKKELIQQDPELKSLNKLDSWGFLPLIEQSHKLANVSALIEMKADVNLRDRFDNTLFKRLVDNITSGESLHDDEHYEKIKVLLDAKAEVDVNLKIKGMTLLMEAANQSHLGLVNTLLERKADINTADTYKNSPLLVICDRHDSSVNKIPIIQALLLAGADYNLVNVHEHRPFSFLKTREEKVIIKDFLKEKFFDPVLSLFFPVTLIPGILAYLQEFAELETAVEPGESSKDSPELSPLRSQSLVVGAQRKLELESSAFSTPAKIS